MKYLIIFLIPLLFVSCDQKSSMDNTKERAAAEQEANTKVENENLAKKAQKMEEELAERHYFYNALEGEYQGSVTVGRDTYNIALTFIRSIPPYLGDRIRQLSEIENDLNNLYFHIQVVQWHSSDQSTAVGCRVSGVRPNMMDGKLAIASTDCPNLYSIFLAENSTAARKEASGEAKKTAEKIKQKKILSVPLLTGTIKPSSNAGKYSFMAKKSNKVGSL